MTESKMKPTVYMMCRDNEVPSGEMNVSAFEYDLGEALKRLAGVLPSKTPDSGEAIIRFDYKEGTIYIQVVGGMTTRLMVESEGDFEGRVEKTTHLEYSQMQWEAKERELLAEIDSLKSDLTRAEEELRISPTSLMSSAQKRAIVSSLYDIYSTWPSNKGVWGSWLEFAASRAGELIRDSSLLGDEANKDKDLRDEYFQFWMEAARKIGD